MFAILIHQLLDPVSIAIAVLVVSLIAGHYGRHKLARGLLAGTVLVLAACILLPVDALLTKPLEDQYPRARLPAHVDGIVVLSGGLRVNIMASRDSLSTNATISRLAAGAALARRYPTARFIFSGASTTNPNGQDAEFAGAERTLRAMGVAPGRTIYERRSLDTWENLVNSQGLARPKPGETWILVTSAVHMPRAMGVARRLGWTMLPWPSDYETAAHLRGQPFSFPSRRLTTVTYAVHEWIGMLVYEILGRMG